MRERFCANPECTNIFDAVADDDLFCKSCLLDRYRELIAEKQENPPVTKH